MGGGAIIERKKVILWHAKSSFRGEPQVSARDSMIPRGGVIKGRRWVVPLANLAAGPPILVCQGIIFWQDPPDWRIDFLIKFHEYQISPFLWFFKKNIHRTNPFLALILFKSDLNCPYCAYFFVSGPGGGFSRQWGIRSLHNPTGGASFSLLVF